MDLIRFPSNKIFRHLAGKQAGRTIRKSRRRQLGFHYLRFTAIVVLEGLSPSFLPPSLGPADRMKAQLKLPPPTD